MNTSPPLPTPPRIVRASRPISSFTKQAATFGLFAPLVSFTTAIFVLPLVYGIRLAAIAFCFLQMLIILSGFILGIVALVSTKKYGRRGILSKAIAGTCIIAMAIFVLPLISGIRLALIAFCLLPMLIIISGFILGIVALVSTKKYGRRGIFCKAVAGTCINGLLVLLMLMSIPVFLDAAESATRVPTVDRSSIIRERETWNEP